MDIKEFCVGAYVDDKIVDEIAIKNKFAEESGGSYVEEVDSEFQVTTTNLDQFRELVKVAVAPRDTKDYEEKLKLYTKGTFTLQDGYMPRIYDLEKFHRAFTKYLDKFVQAVVYLSGSPDILLPLNSQKDGLQDGFIQILFQQDNLPKNYIKLIREKMEKVARK